MKIKSCPQSPVRKTENYSLELPYETSVFDILPYCIDHLRLFTGHTKEELVLTDKDITLDYERGYYDAVELVAQFTTLESDANWAVRAAAYEKRLKAYVEWYEQNEDEINDELAARELAKHDENIKRTQEKLAKLSAELARNHRKLASLT